MAAVANRHCSLDYEIPICLLLPSQFLINGYWEAKEEAMLWRDGTAFCMENRKTDFVFWLCTNGRIHGK